MKFKCVNCGALVEEPDFFCKQCVKEMVAKLPGSKSSPYKPLNVDEAIGGQK